MATVSALLLLVSRGLGSTTAAATSLIVDGDSGARSDMDHKSLARKRTIGASLRYLFSSSSPASPSPSATESLPIQMIHKDGQPEIVLPICHYLFKFPPPSRVGICVAMQIKSKDPNLTAAASGVS